LLLVIFGAVMMLGISIFIHELGHLLCGMLVGVKARIFSLGYGKGIWKKRIGETTYQITGIPIGGYVMFKGDQYGKRLKGTSGELLSTPPLKRMIPVLGGPFFNLLLGFGIFFIIALLGEDNSWGNKIFIDKANRDYSAAYQAGLRTGDRIVSINGKKIDSFEEIFANVGLSGGEEIEVSYERKGDVKSVKITPDVFSAGGRPTLMVEPYGERHIVVTFKYSEQIGYWFKSTFDPENKANEYFGKNFPKEAVAELENKKSEKELQSKLASRAIAYLKDGDMILDVEGKPVATIGELQTVLGNYQNQTVNIHLLRKTIPLVSPWSTEDITVKVPVRGSDIVEFFNIVDSKNPAFVIPNLSIAAHDPKISRKLLNIRINGERFKNFEEMKKFLASLSTNEISFETGDLIYKAKFRLKPIGLLGFMADMKFEPERISKKNSIADAFVISAEKVYRGVATSVKAIGLLFRGLISVKDNLSGPVGIVHSAGMSLEFGWLFYLNFVANISIALMFMNLLPIPVADGGHLVLYLYEAIAGKPLPPRAIETIFKIGFIFLLMLGLYVTFNDVTSRLF
jgi:regulator of sigma E protease